MSIKKNFNRQSPIVAHVDITFGDVTSGVAEAAIDLPPNAVIRNGEAVTIIGWSASTATLSVGDDASAVRYLSGGNIKAVGVRVPLVPTGYVHPGGDLKVTVTAASETTGVVRLIVEYIILGRSCATHG